MTRLTLAGLVVAQHSPVGLPMFHSTLARPEEGVDTWVFWQACACGCDGMHVHVNTYKHGTMDPINIDTGSTYFPREHRFFDDRGNLIQRAEARKITWRERVWRWIGNALTFSPFLTASALLAAALLMYIYCNQDGTVCRDTTEWR